jgi:hypothetical protein
MWDILDNVFNELVEGKHFKTQEEAKAWCAFKNQGLVGRYQITPDGAGGFEIFDKGDARYIGERFHREVEAQAWASAKNEELHLGDDYTYGDEPDDLELEAEMEDRGQRSYSTVKNPITSKSLTELSAARAREQVVLNALAGKVKCSSCDIPFRVRTQQQVLLDVNALAIKVTRYINFDGPNLTVDLTCNTCLHTGLYYFDGNPLLEEASAT